MLAEKILKSDGLRKDFNYDSPISMLMDEKYAHPLNERQ